MHMNMNNEFATNTNRMPYNATPNHFRHQAPVYSNRPYMERGMQQQPVQRKGFTRLHNNDRNIYETLVDVVESPVNTYRAGDLRKMIDEMLNGTMHPSMRTKLETLIGGITRSNIVSMLNDYEDLLIRIAPAIGVNEGESEYSKRTNLPQAVVEGVFARGDQEYI